MGSPADTTHFFLSFISYNPDITSDYRRGFKWHNSKASLLGYNQIILYSSTSVFYYPALGPSFFTTDILQTNTLLIRFPPLAPTHARNTIPKIDHEEYVTLFSLKCSRVRNNNVERELEQTPIFTLLIAMAEPVSSSGTNERKGTRQQTLPWPLNAKQVTNKSDKNYDGHYPIMVILTRANYDAKMTILLSKLNTAHVSYRPTRTLQSKPVVSKDTRRTIKSNPHSSIPRDRDPNRVDNYVANYNLVVISTRANYAVITVFTKLTKVLIQSRRDKSGRCNIANSKDARKRLITRLSRTLRDQRCGEG